MNNNNLNKTQFSEHLEISKGRLSQILNDGATNFSIEKLIEYSFKINKMPIINFVNKENYINSFQTEGKEISTKLDKFYNPDDIVL